MSNCVRTLEYKKLDEYCGYKISDYLSLKGFSQKNLATLRNQEKSIYVNGICTHMNQRIELGDVLNVNLFEDISSSNIVPKEIDFKILYEDEDILVIDKPSGLPVHPSKLHPEYSLANGVVFYYMQKEMPFVFRCVNRLDKDTSGITIIAKNMLSSSVLYEDMKKRCIDREYRAIVVDNGIEDEGELNLPIGRKNEDGIERCIDYEKGEVAITRYKVLNRFAYNGSKLAYVSYHLETGRTHQIRVHMKSIGCPLIGDALYNPIDETMDRQALHAVSIKLKHPVTGKSLYFETALPQDMNIILKDVL